MTPWPLGGPDASGLPLVAVHLTSFAAVVLVLAIAESRGRALVDWLGGHATESDDCSTIDELTISVLVGLGLLATGLLGMAMLGAATPTGVLVLVAVVGASSLRTLRGTLVRFGRAVRIPVRSTPEGWPRILAAILTAGLVAVVLPRALLPAADWDSLMYHLPVPLALLEAGGLTIPADNLHVAYSGLPHVLSMPFLAAGLPAAVHLMGAALAGLLGLSVWSTAARLGGPWAATGALCALAGSTMIALVSVTPRVDVTLATWMWVGQAAVLRLLWDGWDRRTAAGAALVLGFGIGVKYHALAYGLALTPLILAAVFVGRPGLALAGRRFGALALGAGVAGALWLAKNALLFGSPLYPFGGGRVVPPWLAERLGSTAHPESVGLDIYWILREARAPFDLFTFLTDPARVSVEGEAAFFVLSPLLLLAVAGVLGRGVRDRMRETSLAIGLSAALPGIVFAVLILGISARTNPRYLIPVIPGLAVAAGLGLTALLRSIPRERRRPIGAFLLILALSPVFGATPDALNPGPGWMHMIGLSTPAETLRARGGGALLLLADRLEDEVPEGERALLVAEARGLYLGGRTLQDNVLTNWPLASASDPEADCLFESGISHLVVGRGSLDFYRARGVETAPLLLDRMETFIERCAESRESIGPWEVVRLRRTGGR